MLTKSEIELVAEEIGLKAHLGKEFKVMAGKKDELLKALLNAGRLRLHQKGAQALVSKAIGSSQFAFQSHRGTAPALGKVPLFFPKENRGVQTTRSLAG